MKTVVFVSAIAIAVAIASGTALANIAWNGIHLNSLRINAVDTEAIAANSPLLYLSQRALAKW